MKQKEQTYENYLKCFAGIFRKHAENSCRSVYTCYIRGGLQTYLSFISVGARRDYMDKCSTTEIIGVHIAKALIAQGWDESNIDAFTDQMQGMVNHVENETGRQFEAVLEDTYEADGNWSEDTNCLRYEWIMAGCPDFSGVSTATRVLDNHSDLSLSALADSPRAEPHTMQVPLTMEALLSMTVGELAGILKEYKAGLAS